MQQLLRNRLLVRLAPRQRPKLGAQGARRRLEQRRHIKILRAEAHAELAQRAARVLIERLHLRLHALTFEDAERLGQLERDVADRFGHGFRLEEGQQRSERLANMRRQPELDAVLRRLAALRRQRVVSQNHGARLQRLLAGDDFRHGIAEPTDRPVIGEHDRIVDRLGETSRARGKLLGELAQSSFLVHRVGRAVGWAGQDLETPDIAEIQGCDGRRGGRFAILHRLCVFHRASFEIDRLLEAPTDWRPVRRGSLPDRRGAANAGQAIKRGVLIQIETARNAPTRNAIFGIKALGLRFRAFWTVI